jgi:8-oxo-dGTP pyrophosphatase MutT (NUDIX family)
LIVRERKPPFRFGFPGGRVEDGETPEAGVVRECREENGLMVSLAYLVERYTFLDGARAYVFRCGLAGSYEATAEVGSEVGWHAPGAVPEPVRRSFYHALPDVLAGRRNVTRANLGAPG